MTTPAAGNRGHFRAFPNPPPLVGSKAQLSSRENLCIAPEQRQPWRGIVSGQAGRTPNPCVFKENSPSFSLWFKISIRFCGRKVSPAGSWGTQARLQAWGQVEGKLSVTGATAHSLPGRQGPWSPSVRRRAGLRGSCRDGLRAARFSEEGAALAASRRHRCKQRGSWRNGTFSLTWGSLFPVCFALRPEAILPLSTFERCPRGRRLTVCHVPPGPTSETGCSRGWAGRRRPPTSGAAPSSSQCHVSSPPARGVATARLYTRK